MNKVTGMNSCVGWDQVATWSLPYACIPFLSTLLKTELNLERARQMLYCWAALLPLYVFPVETISGEGL